MCRAQVYDGSFGWEKTLKNGLGQSLPRDVVVLFVFKNEQAVTALVTCCSLLQDIGLRGSGACSLV